MIVVLVFVVIFPDITVWWQTFLFNVITLCIDRICTGFIAYLFIHGILLFSLHIARSNLQRMIILVIIMLLVMRSLRSLLFIQREFLEIIPLVVSERHILVIFINSEIIFHAIIMSVLLESQFLLFFILFLFVINLHINFVVVN
jgi:hypothetical protein